MLFHKAPKKKKAETDTEKEEEEEVEKPKKGRVRLNTITIYMRDHIDNHKSLTPFVPFTLSIASGYQEDSQESRISR